LALLAGKPDLTALSRGSEIEMIRELCGKDFLIITPGVRIEEKKDDRNGRLHAEAIRRGASYIRSRTSGKGRSRSPGPSEENHRDIAMPFLYNRTYQGSPGKPSEKARRLLIRRAREGLGRTDRGGKKRGVQVRIMPSEAFTKKCGSSRSHVCLERDDFDYTDQDAFLQRLDSMNAPFLCASTVCRTRKTGNIVEVPLVWVDASSSPKTVLREK